MSKRTLFILTGAAVVLILLAVFGQQRPSTTTAATTPLLPDLESRLNDITRLKLAKAGNEAIATLEKSDKGWTVAEKDGYPADVTKIRAALVALAQARIIEEKTANPDLYDRLGVRDISDDSATGIGLTYEADGKPTTVILGDSEGHDHRYIRRADDVQSYLIDQDPEIPDTAAKWVDPTIVDIDPARVQEVVITHKDGESVRIHKNAKQDKNFVIDNVPEGRELLYTGVANTAASLLRDLRLQDVAQAETADPAVTTVFRTFDGLVLTASATGEGEKNWVTFQASFDSEQASRYADANAKEDSPAVAASEDQENQERDGDAAEGKKIDASSEAEELQQRLSGWRYQLASYQFEQLSRRMEDLLKPKS
jgi:hypothetical protein